MEYGIPFGLETSGGSIAFNAWADETVLVLQDATGFDGAALRQLIQDAPQRDGALIFPAKRAAQYPALQGVIVGDTPEAVFTKEQEIKARTNEITEDFGILRWTNSDGVSRRMRVALTNLSIQNKKPKEFLVQFVSDDAAKYGETLYDEVDSGEGTFTLANAGDMRVWPIMRVYGDLSQFSLYSIEAGIQMELESGGTANIVSSGDFIEIDMLRDTLYYNSNPALPMYDELTDTSDSFPLLPGDNRVEFLYTGSGGSVEFIWRDGWA